MITLIVEVGNEGNISKVMAVPGQNLGPLSRAPTVTDLLGLKHVHFHRGLTICEMPCHKDIRTRDDILPLKHCEKENLAFQKSP